MPSKITTEQMVDILNDSGKLSCLLYILLKQEDLEEIYEEHGVEKIVELAFEAVAEQYGGEA